MKQFFYLVFYTLYYHSWEKGRNRVHHATTVIAFLITFNVLTLICGIWLLSAYEPSALLFPLLGVFVGFLVVGYLRFNKRYLGVLKEATDYVNKEHKGFKIKVLVYVIVSVSLFILVYANYYSKIL